MEAVLWRLGVLLELGLDVERGRNVLVLKRRFLEYRPAFFPPDDAPGMSVAVIAVLLFAEVELGPWSGMH